LGDDRARI